MGQQIDIEFFEISILSSPESKKIFFFFLPDDGRFPETTVRIR